MWSSTKTHIDTLHIHRNGADRTRLVRALARMLGGADLRPTGVPPSAVLFVRRMADPLPQRLAPGQAVARVDPAWERAVQQALADAYRRAARPRQGHIPAGADVVCFADMGEMMACLALDMQRGRAWQRWWWRVPLRDFPQHAADNLAACLYRNVQFLPAILQHLTAWGQAGPVVGALSPEQVRQILVALLLTFDLDDFTSTFQTRDHAPPSADAAYHHEAPEPSPHQARPLARYGRLANQPPWAAWIAPAAVPATLTKAQSCLLGLGVLLYQQPAVARSQDFQQALCAWWAAPPRTASPELQPPEHYAPQSDLPSTSTSPPAPPVADPFVNTNRPDPAVSHTTAPSADDARPDVLTPNAATNDIPLDLTAPQVTSHHADPAIHESTDLAGSGSAAALPPGPDKHILPLSTRLSNTDPAASADPTRSPLADPVDQQPASIREAWTVDSSRVTFDFADGVETQVGGVLFLINLMRHLNLPDCFAPEWHLASQIGPWGTLELLGRALLPHDPALVSDPLWAALAMLDGRTPGTLPGIVFRGGDSLRLPQSWPMQLDKESTCFWATSSERFWLWTDAGYSLLDCPRNHQTPEIQARAELHAYLAIDEDPLLVQRPVDQMPGYHLDQTLAHDLHPDLVRWLAFVMPYLCFRLVQALQLDPDHKESLAQTMLLRRGQLYVTSTHVDLVMRLEDISLPVRIAGLDANPGWLAHFGRVILLHFE